MKWIISSKQEIVVDKNQLDARHNFIKQVTGAQVTNWSLLQLGGKSTNSFLCCTSNDGVDGTFITAHIGEVVKLCHFPEIANSHFVIANTCIWEDDSDKQILSTLMKLNKRVELWFAKQKTTLEGNMILRQSNTLTNVGRFGFQSSISERELFTNRRNGLLPAIMKAFVRVSLIYKV